MAAGKEEPKDQGGEKPQKLEFRISYCRHDSGNPSLSILTENHHTDLTAYSWDHKPGYHITWTIYELTPDDAMALGNAILETSFRMKQEQGEMLKG